MTGLEHVITIRPACGAVPTWIVPTTVRMSSNASPSTASFCIHYFVLLLRLVPEEHAYTHDHEHSMGDYDIYMTL
jgi:hypothetical protein